MWISNSRSNEIWKYKELDEAVEIEKYGGELPDFKVMITHQEIMELAKEKAMSQLKRLKERYK